MVTIRLKRIGKPKQPFYRVVVMDSRAQRDGKTIDDLGFYQPWLKKKQSKINTERYTYWVGKGATPSPTVKKIFKTLGKTPKEA